LKSEHLLYLQHTKEYSMPGLPGMRHIETRLGCVGSDITTAEALVRLLLRGIAADAASPNGSRPIAQPIGRVELFNSWHDRMAGPLRDQGMVLFDIEAKPILHVSEAVIGYDGGGSQLTWAILDELGVDLQIFKEIQEAYWNVPGQYRPYYVVVQRARCDDEGVKWRWSAGDPHSGWD
jgi:hypothetical protein